VKKILKDDDSGQFILLMSIIVAIGLVIILIFFNQSLMAGHSSAQSIMDFPKDDIRDFKVETLSEAQELGARSNSGILLIKNDSTTAFNDSFNSSFDTYIAQVQDIFAQHGTRVDVRYRANIKQVPAPGNKTLYMGENMTINLYYNNGETSYDDNNTVYFD
jgi:hypothetical protein